MQKLAIVLAAGKGTRMRSDRAKVSHDLMGKPMLHWVLDALKASRLDKTYVVVGHQKDEVLSLVEGRAEWVEQAEQLGTGHAVKIAVDAIETQEEGLVLVTCGDTPLISGETMADLIAYHESHGHIMDILTVHNPKPTGYGRICRDDHDMVEAIIEEKDAKPVEKSITEINVGTYCFRLSFLRQALKQLDTDNAQKEFYLTDLVKIARKQGHLVGAFIMQDLEDGLGVNNRVQLSQASKSLQRRINEGHMLAGVTMQDPATAYIEAGVQIGPDTLMEPNVMVLGDSRIGSGCRIGAQTTISNTQVGEGTTIFASRLDQAQVGSHCNLGPFAYLRPGTVLADHVKVGDFVEVKNSTVGQGTKIPHHAYIGDADLGSGVNIGCGTITCNYDGKHKYRTTVADGVFVGSNSNLVAPLSLGQDAYVGAGSTITKDVPARTLAVARARQSNYDRVTPKKDQESEDRNV